MELIIAIVTVAFLFIIGISYQKAVGTRITEKPFICPNCGNKFYAPWWKMWYKKNSVYLFQSAKLKCPHCGATDVCKYDEQVTAEYLYGKTNQIANKNRKKPRRRGFFHTLITHHFSLKKGLPHCPSVLKDTWAVLFALRRVILLRSDIRLTPSVIRFANFKRRIKYH